MKLKETGKRDREVEGARTKKDEGAGPDRGGSVNQKGRGSGAGKRRERELKRTRERGRKEEGA